MSQLDIPAGSAVSVDLAQGQTCRVVNTWGGQVVDTWAFVADDYDEYLSMEHSRSANYKLLFVPGDCLYSNRFRPLLRLAADTSPGIHDTLHAACSKDSYRYYGAERDTPNCQDNLVKQMTLRRFELKHVPCPWNLFEHALVAADLSLADEPSAAKAGDYIELEAMVDLLLVCSACPSMIGQISGGQTRGAAIEMPSR
jgi:uncharacterized protein YcgI (DUF1989 family)